MNNDLQEALRGDSYFLFDGAMGTMLQAAGLKAGDLPELLNLTNPDEITAIHRAYTEAGADIATTNTFGANRIKLAGHATVDEIFQAAVACARASGVHYIAGDIGPIGALLRPMGTLSFDEAYDIFAEEARAAEKAGADLILIETMTDLLEIKAAVLAAKENTSLPIVATMTFEEDGRTFLGTSPAIAAVTLDALGVDALGINCSLGPAQLRPFIQQMLAVTEKPVIVQANAGLPRVEDGQTVYDIHPEEYAAAVANMVDDGAGIIGGCCGTNPEYIRLLSKIIEGRTPPKRHIVPALTVASAQSLVSLPLAGHEVAVIGERINPTGKKRLQKALKEGDYDYVVSQGIAQQEQGADILDVNVGVPKLDQAGVIQTVVERLSASTLLPLQIDSTDPEVIEAAVRRCPGKPIINSVNGERKSLDAVLPIAAHYGTDLVALTLDDDGIPETAEGRFAIAERIVHEAEGMGIPRDRIIVDCLVMTASTNQKQIPEILEAIRMVKARLGVKTVLGVSNVSFGMPQRELLNSTFLAAAFGAGLDLAIMNPASERYMDVVRSYRVLNAEDVGSVAYIEHYGEWEDPYKGGRGGGGAAGGGGGAAGPSGAGAGAPGGDAEDPIKHLVKTGRKGEVAELTRQLLQDPSCEPMELINEHFIPALDEVGVLFDQGKFFLPQLMASAEAARAGFDTIKSLMPASSVEDKGAIVLATVKGDIHDIGKNIVKMLLENYGYTVYDLGRDVDPQAVVDAVHEHDIHLVGLSALMTTTVQNMEETIELVHKTCPDTLVLVGGAVLTPEYAKQIGADYYAKDAAESARIAEAVFGDKGEAGDGENETAEGGNADPAPSTEGSR